MFLQKKAAPRATALPSAATCTADSEPFEVDLREALASTSVHELSFEEFMRLRGQSSEKRQ